TMPDKATIHLSNKTSFTLYPGGYTEHTLPNGKNYAFGFTIKRNDSYDGSVSATITGYIYKPGIENKFHKYNQVKIVTANFM
ncbi:MAG: hypothetical protein IKY00_03140, partial [Clostridia bacterium]|nr:hypothetical protein [Clostridia bacterium]